MTYPQTISDQDFEEIQRAAVAIWKTHNDEHGYASEKMASVLSMENVGDNWSAIVGMFDWKNKVALRLGISSDNEVSEYLDWYIGEEQRAVAMLGL